MLRDPSAVEDVLQTAVAEAFARFDCYAEGTNFRAWIFRFVTLEIFNRNRKREPVASGDFAAAPAPPADGMPEVGPESLLEDSSWVMEHFEQHVAAALWRLAPAERAILLLRALGELSYQEIQRTLAIPLGSVMGYLSRARHKMRQSLAEHASQRGASPPASEPKS